MDLTIRGHILGKDGIFACALVVEMLAKTGQKVSELLERVYGLTGRLYYVEESLPATPEMRIAVPKRLKEAPSSHIGPYKVVNISHMDGTKLLSGKRQLGVAAIFRYRAGAAVDGRGRHSRESEGIAAVVAAVRYGGERKVAEYEPEAEVAIRVL